MDLRRLRYGGGAFKLIKELEVQLFDDDCVAWAVPVGDGDENYLALVVGRGDYAKYIRHVGEVSLNDALKSGLLTQDSEPSRVPTVSIPIRYIIPGDGVIMEQTKPTTYLGYRLHKAEELPPSPFDYSLDLHSLGRDLSKFRQEKGWSMTDAALNAGLSEHTWTRMEYVTNKQPRAETLLRLLHVMDVEDYGKYMSLKDGDS